MQGPEFDEIAFFRAIHESGARALLIGRRALVLIGLPVLTADYDFWIAIDHIAVFNGAVARSGLLPTRDPDEARASYDSGRSDTRRLAGTAMRRSTTSSPACHCCRRAG